MRKRLVNVPSAGSHVQPMDLKEGPSSMKQKTEKDKADLVVRKIIQGMETNAEDQQVYVNNTKYIEERLRDSLKVKG